MATPTKAAVANDLGERCQIIVGSWGYWLDSKPRGTPAITFRPLTNRRDVQAYVAPADYLTVRDADDPRVFMNDWRRGAGQVGFVISDPISTARFYDSSGIDVSDAGRISLVRSVAANANGTSANTTALPLTVAGTYLYMGDLSKVFFSTTWGGAASSAATSSAGNVLALENDGQYVYGCVASVGINRWTIGSTSAGSAWNATVTGATRILWANRIFYAIDGASFYSLSTAGVATTQFTPPTGWTPQDIATRRGGAVDSPILILASAGNRSFVWYWDGTAIHDYLALPTGFVGLRILVYQGVTYISGYRLNPDASVSPCAYYIQNDTLGFIGYFGLLQSNGNPTAAGVTTAANYAIDAYDHFVYFSVSTTAQDIWRYDIVNGGLTRYVQVASGTTNRISDLRVFQNGPWTTLLGSGLYGTLATFVTSGTLDTSDLNGGQPWTANLWLKVEVTFSALRAGEQVACSYSTDSGATYTSAGTAASTTGATSASWVLPTGSSSVKAPFIRLRMTLTAGTSQATTPSLYSLAVRFDPVDPSGVVIEADLACADEMYMKDGAPDWQGGSGGERLYNIQNLYEAGNSVTVIYMAPASTRAKNPKSITARIEKYEMKEASAVGLTPNKGIEGVVTVQLREIA